MNEQKNCGGACCRAFTLPVDYDTLRRSYEWWLRDGNNINSNVLEKAGVTIPFNYYRPIADIHLIFPMVIPLGKHDKTPQGSPVNTPVDWFTCKHFDKGMSLCTIYDHRPQMCRDYPYGSWCTYPGCQHDRAETDEVRKLREDDKVKGDLERPARCVK
jgi:Fe-S-cluster containining protein